MNCHKGPVSETESLAHPSFWCAPALPVFTPLHWLNVIYQADLSTEENNDDHLMDADSEECARLRHAS
ncbi:hypothetical protein [Prosthecobacter vanneervenii]|uniref:Uncharacterized protein n=1 Tax=Prosthecobacter vanneervenii TaxID=48466 RepID=A0A7W8DKI9_9BACT|nr:hypothetical protein [Prosthecobacter vanneervenii]MBB5033304.1 hypothetical protein [Prosthecobacter vanneervenii]